MTSITLKTTELADELAAATPRLGAEEQRLAVTLFRLLGEGKPVSPERLATALDRPREDIAATLSELRALYFDDQDRVIGFWGISVVEMPHKLHLDGRTVHAWCAFDTLFIPEILGEPATVESTCPTTRETVTLRVTPQGVEEVSPPGVVLSFLRREEPFDEDVIRSFCHFVHFFASEEAGRKWIAEHDGTFLLSIEQGFELGRLANRATFGTALDR